MTIRDAIIAEAREWIGVRWQHQASVKGVACDCIGLVRGVARGVGFNDPFATGEARKFAGYGRLPEIHLLREACARFLVPIRRAEALPGDVLTFHYGKYPMHFALLVGGEPPYMIHGHARARQVVENRVDVGWMSRFTGAHRYRELA